MWSLRPRAHSRFQCRQHVDSTLKFVCFPHQNPCLPLYWTSYDAEFAIYSVENSVYILYGISHMLLNGANLCPDRLWNLPHKKIYNEIHMEKYGMSVSATFLNDCRQNSLQVLGVWGSNKWWKGHFSLTRYITEIIIVEKCLWAQMYNLWPRGHILPAMVLCGPQLPLWLAYLEAAFIPECNRWDGELAVHEFSP